MMHIRLPYPRDYIPYTQTRCAVCDTSLQQNASDRDHILPKWLLYRYNYEVAWEGPNVRRICHKCNLRKGPDIYWPIPYNRWRNPIFKRFMNEEFRWWLEYTEPVFYDLARSIRKEHIDAIQTKQDIYIPYVCTYTGFENLIRFYQEAYVWSLFYAKHLDKETLLTISYCRRKADAIAYRRGWHVSYEYMEGLDDAVICKHKEDFQESVLGIHRKG